MKTIGSISEVLNLNSNLTKIILAEWEPKNTGFLRLEEEHYENFM